MSKATQLIMQEPIPMPGFPQIVVTRRFAFAWLKGCGWPLNTKQCHSYRSLEDFIVAQPVAEDPLTDFVERDRLLDQVRLSYKRTTRWRQFECERGNRWMSVHTQEQDGDICRFAGCAPDHKIMLKGTTTNGSKPWFRRISDDV